MSAGANSKQLFDRAKRVLPGGVSSPVRAYGAVGGTLVFSIGELGSGWFQGERFERTTLAGQNLIRSSVVSREMNQFTGVGGNLGVLWDITPRWTLGAVFKTPLFGGIRRELRRFLRKHTQRRPVVIPVVMEV